MWHSEMKTKIMLTLERMCWRMLAMALVLSVIRSRGTSDFSLWGGNKFSGQTMGLVWRQKKRIGQTGEKKMSKRWDETKKCRLAGESPCSLNPPWRSFWAMTPSSWHQLPHGACKLAVCKMQGWGMNQEVQGKLDGYLVCLFVPQE